MASLKHGHKANALVRHTKISVLFHVVKVITLYTNFTSTVSTSTIGKVQCFEGKILQKHDHGRFD